MCFIQILSMKTKKRLCHYLTWTNDIIFFRIKKMSSYRKIASEFKKYGYEQSHLISEKDLNKILDKMADKNAKIPQFDRSVSQQIMQQVQKPYNDKCKVQDIINTILKAQQALKMNIKMLQQQAKVQKDPETKKECIDELFQFQEDLRLVTLTFGLPQPSRVPQLDGYNDADILVTNRTLKTKRSGKSEHQSLSDKTIQSLDLVVVFIATLVWIFFDLLKSFQTNNFLSILSAILILGIYWLQCFEKHYVRTCIVSTFFSIVFDIIWMLSMSKYYWNPNPPSHRNWHQFHLHFAAIVTIVLMVVKLTVLILIYGYRHNAPETVKTVKLYSYQVELSARPAINPLAPFYNTDKEVLGLH